MLDEVRIVLFADDSIPNYDGMPNFTIIVEDLKQILKTKKESVKQTFKEKVSFGLPKQSDDKPKARATFDPKAFKGNA